MKLVAKCTDEHILQWQMPCLEESGGVDFGLFIYIISRNPVTLSHLGAQAVLLTPNGISSLSATLLQSQKRFVFIVLV